MYCTLHAGGGSCHDHRGGGGGVGVKPHRSASPEGWGGGGLVSSLTGQRPLWVGSNQPRKRVDVVGMHKKVERGETKV